MQLLFFVFYFFKIFRWVLFKTAFQENVGFFFFFLQYAFVFTLCIYTLISLWVNRNHPLTIGRRFGVCIPKKSICSRTKFCSIEIKYINEIKSELIPCALPPPLPHSWIDCRAVQHSVLKRFSWKDTSWIQKPNVQTKAFLDLLPS